MEEYTFADMPDILINGFRAKIEEDIANGKQINYLEPSLCFAYYDAEIMRHGRYGFYAIMGTSPGCVANSVDITFEKAMYSWDRVDLQRMEEEIKTRMIELCFEFEENQS